MVYGPNFCGSCGPYLQAEGPAVGAVQQAAVPKHPKLRAQSVQVENLQALVPPVPGHGYANSKNPVHMHICT